VHAVPCHDRRVTLRKVVVKPDPSPAFNLITIRGSGARLANPSTVGLGRNREAQVVQCKRDAHRRVLDAIFVAGDDAIFGFTIVYLLLDLALVEVEVLV